jgi:hypothetical protein
MRSLLSVIPALPDFTTAQSARPVVTEKPENQTSAKVWVGMDASTGRIEALCLFLGQERGGSGAAFYGAKVTSIHLQVARLQKQREEFNA